MKRWDPAIAYLGSGEYAPDMEECASGEYVRHADHAEALLDAMRREKAALDAAEKAREFYIKRTADLNAEITRLGNVIGEMSVAREVACG